MPENIYVKYQNIRCVEIGEGVLKSTDAALLLSGCVVCIALVVITFACTSTFTTFAVWITSCNTNKNRNITETDQAGKFRHSEITDSNSLAIVYDKADEDLS